MKTMKRGVGRGLLLLMMASIMFSGVSYCAVPSTTFPQFTLSEGRLDADGLPISGAKLCLIEQKDVCYHMPSETYGGSKVTYEFGLEPHAKRLQLADGGSWVLFTAMFSGGGSGTLTRFALLRYLRDPKGAKIENLLPWVGATNVSEWATWDVKGASANPILVRADFLWGEGETHFESHFYKVSAWRYDPEVERYIQAFEYKTSRKYGGGDETPIRVLEPERGEITRRLTGR
jgi:hypothetical protein